MQVQWIDGVECDQVMLRIELCGLIMLEEGFSYDLENFSGI